ncbi:hypothetical protein CA13_00380 [Planctomycetes bacterium CA13]|uniref:Uncharacterized protein n=1 Tax=Novipirellula herctigrandis TaxID=2527986 RepID=A0A5C5YUD5_9BACT|nr:hypothetical protein CA13_00380 [Planctomycetes bacterium CA13]
MSGKPYSVLLPRTWHRIALALMAFTFVTGLIPMLIWPLSGLARAYCIACGSIGTVAMALLIVAAVGRLAFSAQRDDVDGSAPA